MLHRLNFADTNAQQENDFIENEIDSTLRLPMVPRQVRSAWRPQWSPAIHAYSVKLFAELATPKQISIITSCEISATTASDDGATSATMKLAEIPWVMPSLIPKPYPLCLAFSGHPT